jgi:hypothetical protein
MLVSFSFCKGKNKKSESSNADYIAENTDFAAKQYGLMTEMIEDSGKILNPKSFINGKHVFIPPLEWTSGFFPGSLWYICELTERRKMGNTGRKTHRSPGHRSISDQHARCGIHDKLQLRQRFAVDGEQSLRKGNRAGSQVTHHTL